MFRSRFVHPGFVSIPDIVLYVPSDCVVCVFQGDRGRDGAPGFPGLQGPPVSNHDSHDNQPPPHWPAHVLVIVTVLWKQYENHQNFNKSCLVFTLTGIPGFEHVSSYRTVLFKHHNHNIGITRFLHDTAIHYENIHPARIRLHVLICHYCPLFSGYPRTSWNEGQLKFLKR